MCVEHAGGEFKQTFLCSFLFLALFFFWKKCPQNFYVSNKTNTFLKAKTNIDNDADCFKMCGGARAAN